LQLVRQKVDCVLLTLVSVSMLMNVNFSEGVTAVFGEI
jgi:hypothetical protein